jgi:hypothetical protein
VNVVYEVGDHLAFSQDLGNTLKAETPAPNLVDGIDLETWVRS